MNIFRDIVKTLFLFIPISLLAAKTSIDLTPGFVVHFEKPMAGLVCLFSLFNSNHNRNIISMKVLIVLASIYIAAVLVMAILAAGMLSLVLFPLALLVKEGGARS